MARKINYLPGNYGVAISTPLLAFLFALLIAPGSANRNASSGVETATP